MEARVCSRSDLAAILPLYGRSEFLPAILIGSDDWVMVSPPVLCRLPPSEVWDFAIVSSIGAVIPSVRGNLDFSSVAGYMDTSCYYMLVKLDRHHCTTVEETMCFVHDLFSDVDIPDFVGRGCRCASCHKRHASEEDLSPLLKDTVLEKLGTASLLCKKDVLEVIAKRVNNYMKYDKWI